MHLVARLTDADIDELRQYFSDSEAAVAAKRTIDLTWTRLKLAQWGSRCRALGLGFPNMSTTEKARMGRGGKHTGPILPPDLEAIDLIVTRLPPQHKRMIAEAYTKHGTSSGHAARLGLSVRDYWRRKTRAEEVVSRRLQILAQRV